MNFCINPNYFIKNSQDAFGLGNLVLNSLNPVVFGEIGDRLKDRVHRAVETLLESRFPEEGDIIDLTRGEVVETAWFLIWPHMVDSVDANNFKLNFRIEEFGEGLNLQRCYYVDTRPLTTDEAGAEQDPNDRRPENPFTPPREIRNARPNERSRPDATPSGDSQPTPSVPRRPQDSPFSDDREPPQDSASREPSDPDSREPPPNLDGTPSEPDPKEDREDGDDDDESSNEEEPTPIEIDIDVESPDLTGIENALERIRREIEIQETANRNQAGDLHVDLLRELRDIEFDVEFSANVDLSEIVRELDEIERQLREPIEAELSYAEETQQFLSELFNNQLSLEGVIDAIFQHGERTATQLQESISEAVTELDRRAGEALTTIGDGFDAIGETLGDSAEKIQTQLRDNVEGFQQWLMDAVTFDTQEEIVEWVCYMLNLFKQIADVCTLAGKGRD